MHDDSLPARTSDPDALAGRLVKSAHLADGVPEIVAGFVFLLYSAIDWLSLPAHNGSIAAKVLILIVIPVAILMGLMSRRTIRWLRARYFIARLGYVRHRVPKPSASQITTVAVLVVAVNILVGFGFLRVVGQHWMLICSGTLFGALWMLVGRRPRFIVGGLLIAGASLLLGFLALRPPIAWGALCTFTGLLALSSGGLALMHSIHETPSPEERQ